LVLQMQREKPSKCHQMNLKDWLHKQLQDKQMRCVRMTVLLLLLSYSLLPPSSGMLKNSELES